MGKRGNGEGTIYQRRDGKWVAQITVGINPKTGKPKRRSFYGKTRREVSQKLREALNSKANGQLLEPNKITVEEWMNYWQNQVKVDVKPTVRSSYQCQINNHIIPQLGRIRLKELGRAQIQNFVNHLAKEGRIDNNGGLSPRTVQYTLTILSGALDCALYEGKISSNPTKGIQIPKQNPKKITPLTTGQAKTFLEGIREDWLYPLFFTALRTGMRRGELLGLQWRDIDFDTKTISVKRSLVEVKGVPTLQDSVKSYSSSRTIRISEELENELRKYRTKQKEHKLSKGQLLVPSDLVFTWDNGKRLNPSYVSQRFRRLLKGCGLPHARFHDLRHTFATILLEAEENPKVVSDMLGHSSIKVTMDVYSHVSPEMQGKAAEKIEIALSGKLG